MIGWEYFFETRKVVGNFQGLLGKTKEKINYRLIHYFIKVINYLQESNYLRIFSNTIFSEI